MAPAPAWTTSTLVFVRDVDASIRFYVDVLGFTLGMRHEENGVALVAGVNRGEGCGLLLTSQWPDRIGRGILYAGIDQQAFDTLCAGFRARGVAMTDGRWGRDVRIVSDPDGNQIYFASY